MDSYSTPQKYNPKGQKASAQHIQIIPVPKNAVLIHTASSNSQKGQQALERKKSKKEKRSPHNHCCLCDGYGQLYIAYNPEQQLDVNLLPNKPQMAILGGSSVRL